MSAAWYQPYAGFAVPDEWGLAPDDAQRLLAETWRVVLTGESDPDCYLDWLEEFLADPDDPAPGTVSEEQVRSFVVEVLSRRRAQQAALGGPPTSALAVAFDELAGIGVIGREGFTCCGTCLAAEIGDQRAIRDRGADTSPTTNRDAETILENRETYVSYGVFLDAYLDLQQWEALSEAEQDALYERLTVDLMEHEVFPVLARHGVQADWNRSLTRRVLLRNVDFFAPV